MKKVDEKQKLSLEDAFEELNLVIGRLEREDTPLEESFCLYQEGMNLLKICNQSIDRVEKQLIILEENGIDES